MEKLQDIVNKHENLLLDYMAYAPKKQIHLLCVSFAQLMIAHRDARHGNPDDEFYGIEDERKRVKYLRDIYDNAFQQYDRIYLDFAVEIKRIKENERD